MKQTRREFLSSSALAAAAGLVSGCKTAGSPAFAEGAEDMGPSLPHAEVRRNERLTGRKCSYFCDDVIWVLRDITRRRPKSAFDHPFLGVLKECHEKYGLKMQLNLFYRTDFFYGLDEFALTDVTDDYKAEFAANAGWLKFGFHSLQEFPDYPWINASYEDVKTLFGRIHGEVVRFAGEDSFARACVPHWCPMSKDGVRALKDCGIRIMECTYGPRYRYDGRPERLADGYAARVMQNRRPEVGFYGRHSICSYNHMTCEQAAGTLQSFNYLHDRETGMNFKRMFNDAPCLNGCTLESLKADLGKVIGREHLVFSNHEQYFYKDYLAYQPEYADKVRLLCRTMRDNGYEFMFLQDLVGE